MKFEENLHAILIGILEWYPHPTLSSRTLLEFCDIFFCICAQIKNDVWFGYFWNFFYENFTNHGHRVKFLTKYFHYGCTFTLRSLYTRLVVFMEQWVQWVRRQSFSVNFEMNSIFKFSEYNEKEFLCTWWWKVKARRLVNL